MTSISGTSTMSSPGIGSGLDVNSIITQLMAVENLPMKALQTKAQGMQTQLSAFGQMQSLVSSLQDATTPLLTASNYSLTSATTSDASSVGVTSSASAVPGNYAVSVSALAAPQTLVSASGQFSAATDVVGTGTLTINLGSWNAGQTAFTPKSGAQSISIAIDSTSNTLAGIRDKINAANAGVTATIVTDSSGARLALQSSSTGAANGFKVSVTDDDGTNTDAAGLSRLAFDPTSGVTQMTQTTAAADTQATVNGISISSPGTTLTNVIQGLTLNVNKVTTSPVQVAVTANTDAVKTMVKSFVAAYNALSAFVSANTAYDPVAKKGALLQGDRTTLSLQSQLHNVLGGFDTASTVFTTLSSIGLQFQKDGSLKVDDTKLSAAVQNMPELQKALANVDTTNPSNNGILKKLSDWENVALGVDGSLPTRQQSIQKMIASNQKDQDALQTRLDLTQKRLQDQYSALDATMSQANSLAKYMTQQITTWNNQKSG
ncbi:flagellar filament capping protein FliD [Roseateles saccharophilus]|uniref:Flagellar hook-associated protein 2 n=1 Tax=Roseateles saccharophilus TaxID=304 RepID=A0A4R3V503_ROSSA|nr:flagellar filament capping protein FliD [Roseateles saccharophilus]MDG0834628.1 flagellar hook protein [Roseateles saccharophilus]TCU98860.1 flagellar hook-associated protein 2 [Roseateles saccharophilus]